MFRTTFFAAIAACAWIGTVAAGEVPPVAAAHGCNLKQLASIPLLMDRQFDALLMPVTLNGVQKQMLIDTDNDGSMLGQWTAEELHLNMVPVTRFWHEPGWRQGRAAAAVERVSFAGFSPQRMVFLIGLPGTDFAGGAGSITPAFRNYDIEFDFASARMNLFEPSSCIEGPYWQNNGAAAIDTELSLFGLIRFPLVLDDKRVVAAIDTTSATTNLRGETARILFNIDPATTHDAVMHSLRTEDGEITINSPRLHLVGSYQRYVTGQPDIYLGLGTLRHLRIYIANGRRKLFLTAASGPPAVTMESPADRNQTPADRTTEDK